MAAAPGCLPLVLRAWRMSAIYKRWHACLYTVLLLSLLARRYRSLENLWANGGKGYSWARRSPPAFTSVNRPRRLDPPLTGAGVLPVPICRAQRLSSFLPLFAYR